MGGAWLAGRTARWGCTSPRRMEMNPDRTGHVRPGAAAACLTCRRGGDARDVSLAEDLAMMQLVSGGEVQKCAYGHLSAPDVTDTRGEFVGQSFHEANRRRPDAEELVEHRLQRAPLELSGRDVRILVEARQH